MIHSLVISEKKTQEMLFSSTQSIHLLLLVLMISFHSGLQHHVIKVHDDLLLVT